MMMESDRKYTNSFNFLRIVATIFIALLHFFISAGKGRAAGWAIFVDFFFCVSGVLLAADVEKSERSTWRYIQSRYHRIWPHFFFGFVMYFVMLFVRCWPDVAAWGGYLRHSFLEVFLLQIFGINEFATNHGAVWYLSVLIVCSGFLYAVMNSKGNKFFIKIYAPFIAVVTPIVFQIVFETEIVEWNSSFSLIGNPSFYRGLYEMTAGVLIYYISIRLCRFVERMNFNNIIRRVFQVLELLLLALIIIGSLFKINTLLLVFCIWIMVFLSWNLKHDIVFSNTLYDKVYVLTLPVYINHALFVDTSVLYH